MFRINVEHLLCRRQFGSCNVAIKFHEIICGIEPNIQTQREVAPDRSG